MADTLPDVIEEIDTTIGDPDARVVLYNDDYHSFEEVIIQIIKACNYPLEQAEQITLMVHHRGKATVITADHTTCLDVAAVLQEIQLLVEIIPVTQNKNS